MHQIIIAGFMGSGKTTVATALAKLLGCAAVDLDEAIQYAERRSPGQIIENDGERRFREIESRVLTQVLEDKRNQVIALGGGTWAFATNREEIAKHDASTVWLQAPFGLCWNRIKASVAERPLAPNEAEALTLFNQRLASYALADLQIEVKEGKSADELAREILRAIALHKK